MKYLHFMMDQFYSKEFIELINTNFKAEEHLFLVIKLDKKRNFIDSNSYNNVKFLNVQESFFKRFFIFRLRIIRNLMKEAEFIIVHYLAEFFNLNLFGYRGKAKIIWVLWGADLYNYTPLKLYDQFTLELLNELNYSKTLFERFFFYLLYEMRKLIIKKIDFVVSPHKGDIKLLYKYFRTKAKWFSLTIYPNPVNFKDLDLLSDMELNKSFFKQEGHKLILLGNSGAPTNNHLDLMIRLSKLNEQNFKILCPLSYGPFEYIEKVIDFGKGIFGDRFIPLLEFLNPESYLKIINQIDLALMYHNRQQGMGTIHIILYLGKPICMKKTSGYYYLIKNGAYIFLQNDLERLISGEIEINRVLLERNKDLALNKIYSTKSTIHSIEKLMNLLKINQYI